MTFDPNPKSAKLKVAFTGTNSSGKTTMAMKTTARLKEEHHVLAELVSSQDRKISWKDDHFPVNPQAHVGMLTNLMHAEVQASLKGDADIIVTDRSALDLFAVALVDHPDSSLVHALGQLVDAWVKTYSAIYYLPPLDYQEDGKRPSDEFRLKTHARLLQLFDERKYPNVFLDVPRTKTFGSILTLLGRDEVKPIFAQTEKWQTVANRTGCTLYVKKGYRVGSDVDVWAKSDSYDQQAANNHVAHWFLMMFGGQIELDLMTMPDGVKANDFPFEVEVYAPKHPSTN